jgi:MFS family permease
VSARGWSSGFVLISILQVLVYANYQMLNPVLAVYLTGLGHSAAFVGIVVAAFGVSSVLTRPLVGDAVDRWSSTRTYLIGSAAMAAATLGYLTSQIATLLFSRAVHGVGWAAINTAGPAIAMDHAPDDRKGSAIGYFNAIRAVTIPVAPALGLWISSAYGFPAVFVLASGLALAASLLSIRLVRPLSASNPPAVPASRLVERRVLLPALVQVLLYSSAPLVWVFMPLMAIERGIPGLAVFYLVVGITNIFVQPLARLSDTFGRGPNIAIGLAASGLGLITLAFADALGILMLGGICWAAGIALVEPATTALAVESVETSRRGAALATYGAAFQVGNGLGGLVWGAVISSAGFIWAFFGAFAFVLAAIAIVAIRWRSIMATSPARTRSTGDDAKPPHRES